jgi:hypothetical protein
MKDKLNTTLLYFLYAQNKQITFNALLFISFVCVTFHVETWLLSSIVRIIYFTPMFRVLSSQLAMLYIDLIKIVLAACHLKNYFCYHLPTWGRAWVKLGDAWYVANVSIILMIYACFTPIALCFVYTSWHFYAFYGTNLLTRCHNASSCFLLFLCFRKVTQEIFSKLDETNPKVPILLSRTQSPKGRQRGARGWPHHRVAWVTPWSCLQVVWAPGPPSNIALPPIYSLWGAKP